MNAKADTLAGDSQAAVDRERRRLWLSAGSAVVVGVVGAAALIGSRSYPYWTPLGPGPGFFPRWLGGILLVGGLLWLAQLLRAAGAAKVGHAGADAHDGGASVADAMVVRTPRSTRCPRCWPSSSACAC